MSNTEELKQLYLSQKDEIARGYEKYVNGYQVLINLGVNLSDSLEEYSKVITNSTSFSKSEVINDINFQQNLLTQYVTQLKKFKNRLISTYEKSERAIQVALNTNNSGDIITALSAYGAFDKEYRGTPRDKNPSVYINGAKDRIEEYRKLMTNIRFEMERISKDIYSILPQDDSGKVFKKEDEPEENIKLMLTDPYVQIFLLLMIGLLGYYLFFMEFESDHRYYDHDYEDEYYEENESRRSKSSVEEYD